jgi:translation initiation factor IF-2
MQGRQDLADGRRSNGATTTLEEAKKATGKVRVYEVAKEIGMPGKDLVSRIQSMGIDVKNHMSSLDVEEVQRVKRLLEKERQANLVEERLSPTVIRRRSKAAPKGAEGGAPSEARAGAGATSRVADVHDGQGIRGGVRGTDPEERGGPKVTREASEVAALAGLDMEVEPDWTEADEQALARGELVPIVGVSATAGRTEEEGAKREGGRVRELPRKEPQPLPGPEEKAAPAVAEAPATRTPPPAAPGAPEAAEAPKPPTAAPLASEAAAAKPETPTKPEAPPVVHRYAPGFKPGMTYGPRGRLEPSQPRPAPMLEASEEKPLSAADAMRLIAPQKPKVVITDLDGRKPGQRREMLTPKELFVDRRFKSPGKKKKKVVGTKKTKKTEITTPAQHKRVIRLEDSIGVGEIAHQMGIKSTEVLKHLWAMGLTNMSINQAIDADTASLLANEFGYEVEDVSFSEDQVLKPSEDRPEDLMHRPPVVTVMGHVDHGKTSLLDAIRNTAVAEGEAGGITQAIGAYKVTTQFGELVFIDTPGHEAFTSMRARGAHCTDIVVLVVAADDGVMPQTREAIAHARDAGVPIIVAVNKIDKHDANRERVRRDLAEFALIPEEWGGETLFVDVSAKTKVGIDKLLETLNLQAELLELQANPNKLAKGVILESKLDRARGAMSTVLVQEGTLKVGDIVVAGEHTGKVRALLDDRGRPLREALPGTPVEILGLGGVPEAGDNLNAVADEKDARTLAEYRQNEHRKKDMTGTSATKSYEELLFKLKSGEAKEIKLLVKADVHGSSEAVHDALLKLTTEKVSAVVISTGVGGITEADVNLAKASGAIILGFNVRPAGKATQLAEREGVEIKVYDIIYEMLDAVKVMMQGLLPKERREKFLGRAEVRETFQIPKVGTVAGVNIQEGRVTRNSQLRLVRDSIKIYDGKVGSLRRFKDDVREVAQGYECGISIDGYNDIKVGDVIEAYEIEEIAPSL